MCWKRQLSCIFHIYINIFKIFKCEKILCILDRETFFGHLSRCRRSINQVLLARSARGIVVTPTLQVPSSVPYVKHEPSETSMLYYTCARASDACMMKYRRNIDESHRNAIFYNTQWYLSYEYTNWQKIGRPFAGPRDRLACRFGRATPARG